MAIVPETACKVCGTIASHLCDTPNEHGDVATIHHFRCPNCGLVFVGNALSNDQLAAAYATLDAKTYYEEVGKTEERKFARSAENLRRQGIGTSSAIIDIGTGNGDFPLFLKKQGFTRLYGHEIPGTDTRQLDAAAIPVYKDFAYESVPDNTFDAATLLDVMEHVPDPALVVRALHRILKPGGIMYCHTPCVTPTDRLMHWTQQVPVFGKVGRMWQRGRTSIFHLQNYTRRSLEIIWLF